VFVRILIGLKKNGLQ